MQDAELLRYSRHILLDDIGIEGQTRILQGHALLIGAGGLGSPAAMYLASSGISHITLVDHDTVDLTNLQRQILHRTDSVGAPKVESAARTLHDLNPHTQVTTVAQRADAALLDQLVPLADVVLDCCDNFQTRHAVNAACVRHGKPLVWAAAIRFDGQISVVDPRVPTAPCYACVFPPDESFEETQCSTLGVFAPLVGVMGSLQAAEALKLLVGVTPSLAGRVLLLDGRRMEWTEMRAPRLPHCPVCAEIGH